MVHSLIGSGHRRCKMCRITAVSIEHDMLTCICSLQCQHHTSELAKQLQKKLTSIDAIKICQQAQAKQQQLTAKTPWHSHTIRDVMMLQHAVMAQGMGRLVPPDAGYISSWYK